MVIFLQVVFVQFGFEILVYFRVVQIFIWNLIIWCLDLIGYYVQVFFCFFLCQIFKNCYFCILKFIVGFQRLGCCWIKNFIIILFRIERIFYVLFRRNFVLCWSILELKLLFGLFCQFRYLSYNFLLCLISSI